MAIPTIFTEQGDRAIASYDFVDIVTGTGYIELYGGDIDASGTADYILSTTPFYSNIGVAQTISTTNLDLDFDVQFGRTLTLEGNAIVNVPFRIQTAGSTTLGATIYIRKYSGSTETDLVNSNLQHTQNYATNQPWCLAGTMAIPRTTFKKGDIFRVSLVVSGVSGKTIDWLFDPMNRATINGSAYGVETSRLKINIPVKIEL